MTNHTPTPWWHSHLEIGDVPMMNIKVAKISGIDYQQAKANAEFIVRACNAHDDLVSSLDLIVKEFALIVDNLPAEIRLIFNIANAALAKAKVQS